MLYYEYDTRQDAIDFYSTSRPRFLLFSCDRAHLEKAGAVSVWLYACNVEVLKNVSDSYADLKIVLLEAEKGKR